MKKPRIENFLSQTITTYIRTYISPHHPELFLSITRLHVTPNLAIASVYVSIISPDKDKQALLATIMAQHHWPIRKYIASRLRDKLRRIPAEVRFYLEA